jgi:exosortase
MLENPAVRPQPADPAGRGRELLRAAPVIAGFLLLAAPTILSLSHSVWTREDGAHGPIIIFTGAWLISREASHFRELGRPGSAWVTAALLTPCLILYAFSRAFDFISLEVAAVYGAGLTMLYSAFGWAPLKRAWFPLLYLAFVIPPPGWLLDQVTAPLKQFVSHVATNSLMAAGLPVAREGVTIYVAQYQLLVEDACSGMNSLVGLVAISLFYIYLLRGASLRYSALLTAFTIPIAVAGNILRIMVLILLTYFYGDQVAQGFMHQLAGVFLFATDLILVFAVDSVLIRVVPRSWRPA